jgi:tRNA threonylcarbamoyladenosine biosynthesis protein TsaE
MFTIFLSNYLETQRLGYLLGKHLPSGSVILLSGNLGAGKTTLVQGIGQGLGIDELITSPTFTLINEYLEGRLPLYHLDLYRLESSQVDSIYPEMYWEGTEVNPGITAIEWWQRLRAKPLSYLELKLLTQGNCREASIKQIGSDYDLKFIQNFIQTNKQ